MKKLAKPVILLLVAALAASLFLFVGCEQATGRVVQGGEPDSFAGKVTVVLDDPDTENADYYMQADYSAFNEGDTAMDVIDYLKEQGELCYIGSEGQYGMYMTSIGVVENGEEKYVLQEDSAAGKYISFYTNVETDMQGSDGITYGSETVEPSMQGVSSMSIEDGAIIYITTIVWG